MGGEKESHDDRPFAFRQVSVLMGGEKMPDKTAAPSSVEVSVLHGGEKNIILIAPGYELPAAPPRSTCPCPDRLGASRQDKVAGNRFGQNLGDSSCLR
jgi:hypothetical protein